MHYTNLLIHNEMASVKSKEETGNTRTEACPSATCSGPFRPHFRDIGTFFCVVCFYVSVWIYHFKNYYTDFEKKIYWFTRIYVEGNLEVIVVSVHPKYGSFWTLQWAVTFYESQMIPCEIVESYSYVDGE